MFQILFHKSELALRLERQRLSVELIPLPDLWRTGHGNHKVDRLFAISPGFIEITSQSMDTSGHCCVETSWADALAWVTSFKLTPFIFQRNDLIPAIQAKGTLALQPNRSGLLS